MEYQEVLLNIISGEGTFLGKLCIRAQIDGEQFDEINDNGIRLRNVPEVTRPTNRYSIEFLVSDDYPDMPKILLLEETSYEVVFEAHKDSNVAVGEILPNIRKFFTQSLFDIEGNTKRGLLNFHSYVGRTYLSVAVNGEESLPIYVEVRSKKIGYADEYAQMMFDLSEDCSSLIYESKSPVHHYYDFGSTERQTRFEDFLFLQYLFREQNLPDAYAYIRNAPHNALIRRKETVPLGFATSINPNCLVNMVSSSKNLSRPEAVPDFWPKAMRGYIPNEIIQSQVIETLNTPENRFIKYFLESIAELITGLLESTKEEFKQEFIKKSLKFYQSQIEEWLSDDWLKSVGFMRKIPANSQVLQKREGYREIYYFFLHMNFAFKFKWNELDSAIKSPERRMSELYEYWSYFRLLSSLKSIAVLKSLDKELVKISHDGWEINLKRGHKSCVKYEYLAKNENSYHLELYYNRRFSRGGSKYSRSYSLPFSPDFTLVLRSNNDDSLPIYIHFDAKYRAESELDGLKFINEKKDDLEKAEYKWEQKEEEFLAQMEQEEEVNRKYKAGDICKMHTYKDAIIYSIGAYVLYPGNKQRFFKEDYADEKDVPSIGAFPLRPSRRLKGTQETALSSFLEDALECTLS